MCVDKGTYDAVSLDPDDAGQKRRRYVDSVLGLLEDGGMLIITSCNWTEHELKSHFTPRKFQCFIRGTASSFSSK